MKSARIYIIFIPLVFIVVAWVVSHRIGYEANVNVGRYAIGLKLQHGSIAGNATHQLLAYKRLIWPNRAGKIPEVHNLTGGPKFSPSIRDTFCGRFDGSFEWVAYWVFSAYVEVPLWLIFVIGVAVLWPMMRLSNRLKNCSSE